MHFWRGSAHSEALVVSTAAGQGWRGVAAPLYVERDTLEGLESEDKKATVGRIIP